MRYVKFWISVLILFYCITSYALNIGDDAPKLDIARWVKGKRVILYPKKAQVKSEKNFYVIFFWATWSNSSSRLLEFVEKEYQLYKNSSVVFIGISKESPRRVSNFLEKVPDITYSIGVDNQAKTYDKYMEGTKGVPVFFVFDKSKELLWRGSPFELDRVLSRVISGTFDIDKHLKVERLRQDIRNASQFLDNKNKLKAAKKTLDIDPTDEVAVNIIIDDYIREDKLDEAIAFLEKTMKKTKGNIFLQQNLVLLELTIIPGMKNISNAKKILLRLTKNCYEQFYNNPQILNNIASAILQNMPFEIRPLNELLKMAIRCVAAEKRGSSNPEMLGIYYQTLARTYYSLGCFSKALDAQSKAVVLLKSQDEKNAARLKEEYYKETLSQYKADQNPDSRNLSRSINNDKSYENIDSVELLKEKGLLELKLQTLHKELAAAREDNDLNQNIIKQQRKELLNSAKYDDLLQEKIDLENKYNDLIRTQKSKNISPQKIIELKKTQDELLKKDREIRNIAKENEQLELNNFNLKRDYNKLKEARESEKLAIVNNQKEILSYKNKIDELKKQLQELSLSNSNLKNINQTKDRQELNKTVHLLQEKLNKANSEKNLLQKKLTTIEKKILLEGNDSNSINSSSLDDSFEKLQLKILDIEKMKENIEFQRDQLTIENAKLKDENNLLLNAQNKEHTSSEFELEKNRQKVFELEKAVKLEKRKNEALGKKYSLLKQYQTKDAEPDLNELLKKIESLNKRVRIQEEENNKLVLLKKELEDKNNLLAEENRKLEINKPEKNNSKSNIIIADLKLNNKNLQEKIDDLQQQLKNTPVAEMSGLSEAYSTTDNDSNEVQKLKKQIELSQSNIMRLQQYNEKIQEELNNAKEKLVKLQQNESNNIVESNSNNKALALKNKNNELSERVQKVLQKSADYEIKLQTALLENDNLNEKLKLLKEEKNILTDKINSMTEQVDSYANSNNKSLVEAKKDLNVALEENSKLEDKLKSSGDRQKDLINKIKILEKKNIDLSDKIKTLTSNLENKNIANNESLIRAKKDLNIALEENANLEDKLKSERLQQMDLGKRLESLKVENNSLNKKIDTLTFDIKKNAEAENIKLASVKKDLNNALQNNLNYEDRLKTSQETIEKLKSQNALLVNKNLNLDKELKDVSSNLSASGESEISKKLELVLLDNITYKNKIKIFDKKVNRLNSENLNLREENNRLSLRVKNLSKGVDQNDYSFDVDNERFQSLEEQIDKLKKENSILQKEKLSLNRKIDLIGEYSAGDSGSSMQYENLKKDYDEAIEKNLAYENRLQTLQTQLYKLKNDHANIAQFDESMIKSSEEYIQLKNELDTIMQENLSNIANTQTLQEQLNELKADNSKLKRKNSEYNNEIEDLNSRLKQKILLADDKYLDVQKELDLALQEKMSYKNEIGSINNKLDELSAQNLKLKNDKISLNKEINEIVARTKNVQSEADSKYSNVKKKLDLALQDNLKLEKKLRSLDDNADQVKKVNNDLIKEKNELSSKIEEISSKFEKEQANAATELSRVSKDLDQAVQENLTFENKLRSLDSKVNSLAQENAKLQAQKNTYSKNIREVAQRLKSEHYERIRLNKELESAKLQYDISTSALQQENNELKNKLLGYQKVIKSISELNQ